MSSELTAVSLFAGIGGFDLALERAGVRVVAAVEIDPDCRALLRRHFPDTVLFDDVREVTGDQLRAAGFDPGRGILTGGFPCQDLSVAGLRAGLAGARSGLFWQIMRLADELSPRWLLLENVPGLLSAVCSCPGDETCVDNGRAVRCGRWEKRDGKRVFLPHVPHTPPGGACPDGCMGLHGGAMGTVLGALGERGYGFAYRVLDAQFFGVPQRRERVFIAGCLGDRAAPVEILLEPESSDRHSPAGAAAGTRVAGTLVASAGSGGLGGAGQSANAITNRLVETASTLQGGGRRGHRVDAEGAAGGHLVAFDAAQITHPENRANPQPGDPAPPLASTGQPMRGRDGGSNIEAGEPGDPAFTVRTPGGGSSYPMVAAPVTSREARRTADSDCTNGVIVSNALLSHHQRLDPNEQTFVTHALTSEGADASEDGTGRGTPLVTVPVAATLTAGTAAGDGVREPGRCREDDENLVMSLAVAGDFSAGESVTQTVRAANGQPSAVSDAAAVRRLTPKECERLQGFPDNWTLWQDDGSEQSDSARYRQLGNAVAVPVVQWIAERTVAVDGAAEAEGAA